MGSQDLLKVSAWKKTLNLFKVDEVRSYSLEKSELNKARAVIGRMNDSKEFTTNTLLSGGFEIKRIK